MAWIIDNGELTNTEFIGGPEHAMTAPYPDSLWRIDPLVNGGLPYTNLMIGMGAINLFPEPHSEVIRVYDMTEPQTGYQHNGLAILTPAKAEISEESEGMYEYIMSHPIDDFGRWQHLLECNVVKSREGQLFRIYRRELSMDSKGATVNVNARHISYDFNDRLIAPCNINGNGQTFLDSAVSHLYDHTYYNDYDFTLISDITDTVSADYANISMTAVLIGADNSFVNLTGAELYRDNFYISLNKRREKARDNAFNIRYGVDMTKIRMTVDYSDLCTWLIAEDNFGNYWASSYVSGDYRFHHHVTKHVTLNYDTNDYDRFKRDAKAYFDRYWHPNVSFEVEFAPLQNDPRYADFMDLQHCNVGDTGRIYCEPLKIDVTLKVVAKKTNDITGETISVTINNLQSSFVRQKYMSSTISTGTSAADKQMAAIRQELRNTKLKMLTTWRSASAFTWREAAEFTWREVSNNNG